MKTANYTSVIHKTKGFHAHVCAWGGGTTFLLISLKTNENSINMSKP